MGFPLLGRRDAGYWNVDNESIHGFAIAVGGPTDDRGDVDLVLHLLREAGSVGEAEPPLAVDDGEARNRLDGQLLAEAELDKAMLKDVLSKKW